MYKQFESLLLNNFNLFVESRSELKAAKLPPLFIKLKPGVKPIRKKPYATSAVQRDAIRETVQELLDGGQIALWHEHYTKPLQPLYGHRSI